MKLSENIFGIERSQMQSYNLLGMAYRFTNQSGKQEFKERNRIILKSMKLIQIFGA
jgi:hypothetical protein